MITEETFEFRPGSCPVLVSIPHAGTELPPSFVARLNAAARDLPDTDWHLPRLYGFLDTRPVGLIRARMSRYVVDLNRAPDDTPLYAGATTGLCPDVRFDGTPLYRPGAAPDAAEIAQRVETYWRPYHARIRAELTRLRDIHGFAVLFDAHSIKSTIPRLFPGRLPDFNLGTARGASADPALSGAVEAALNAALGYSLAVNGRFVGGHITRSFGKPAEGWHAVQLEMAQTIYMDEDPPFAYAEDRAAKLQPHLARLVDAMIAWTGGLR